MHGLTAPILNFLAAHWPAVLLVLTAAWLIRNRFQKGLHKYPGPFLASLTDWWRFWDVYNRRPELTHRRLHEKHGEVVRLGPNTLSFSSPKALKPIYGLNKNMVKSDFYVVQQAVVKDRQLQSLFSTVDEAFHARFRRCVNAAFSMSALIQYEPFVDNTTRLFLKQTQKLWADNPSGCDLGRWLQFYAFDVIGEITYSKHHGFIENNKDIDGIVERLGRLFLYVAPVGQIPWLDLLFLKNPIYLKLSQWGLIDATSPVAKFACDRMAERTPLEKGASINGGFGTTTDAKVADVTPLAKSPDLLSKFLAAKQTHPEFMTDGLVQTMAVSMAFAGSETTAISLSAILYYLLRNRPALERLRAEIDDAARAGLFSDTETGLVTWNESQRLPYLDACVKEGFRVHPAAGLPLERIVPPGGVEIAGHFVPGGTIVGVSAWVLHNNKEIFGDDVDVFRPERWLVDEDLVAAAATDAVRARVREQEEQRIKEMSGMMLQFGMGSRTCIGKNISLLEIYKLLPTLLRRFEIDFKDPGQEWEIVNAWFVKQNNFWVKFRVRKLVLPESQENKETLLSAA